MKKKFQNMNQYGTTTCGLIIDYENKKAEFFPQQSIEVASGKKVSKKKIFELIDECKANGFEVETVTFNGNSELFE